MSIFEQRLSVVSDTITSLNIRIRELERLRDEVKKAQLSAEDRDRSPVEKEHDDRSYEHCGLGFGGIHAVRPCNWVFHAPLTLRAETLHAKQAFLGEERGPECPRCPQHIHSLPTRPVLGMRERPHGLAAHSFTGSRRTAYFGSAVPSLKTALRSEQRRFCRPRCGKAPL
jgi:hypothetical protein